MMDFLNKYFKLTIVNMSEELKKNMLKEQRTICKRLIKYRIIIKIYKLFLNK